MYYELYKVIKQFITKYFKTYSDYTYLYTYYYTYFIMNSNYVCTLIFAFIYYYTQIKELLKKLEKITNKKTSFPFIIIS